MTVTVRRCAAILLFAGALSASPPLSSAQAPAPVTVGTAGGDVTVLADRIEQVGPDDLTVATGRVEITRGTARLLADRVEINRATGDATAQGNVIFYDGEDRLTGQRIDYNIKTGTGVVHRGEARAAPYYRLGGERLERLSESVYRVRRGVFTTCEDDPPAWSFRFGSATADLDDIIYGTNASFWVKGVPLIPLMPFFAAAIRRERQTGFLPPQLGTSSRKGVFAEVPFYWAISDSQDATLALELFERRGIGAAGEYRYVLSDRQRGALNVFYVRETAQNDDDRGWAAFKHDWTLAPGLAFRADLNGVSDDGVLRMYEDSLARRATQRAESNLSLTRTWENWNLVGRLFWYQDLTTPRRVELQRLPEVVVQGTRQAVPGLPGVLYQLDASAVNFMREVGSEGARVDLHPQVARPVSLAGYATLTPFLGGRLTAYDRTVTGVRVLDGESVETTESDARVRRMLEFGGDLESRLSRVYRPGGAGGFESLLHSIEPRLRYTRLVGDNFYGLPAWTTRVDRIPEGSWLEYSITNRIRGKTVSPVGTEAVRVDLVRFVVAHAYDVQERRVGNVAADLIVQPTERLRFRADASYNVQGAGFQSVTSDLAFSVPYVTASIGTRYTKQQLGAGPTAGIVPEFVQVPGTYNLGGREPNRATVSFLTAGLTSELTRNVAVRAHTFWDIRSNTFVENRFGVDLRFDCWGLLLEYVDRAQAGGSGRAEDEFRFAINLLGIGQALSSSLGTGAGSGGPRLK